MWWRFNPAVAVTENGIGPASEAMVGRVSAYPDCMDTGERDLAGWAELRAFRDDDRLGAHVRLLLNAHARHDPSTVRAQASRLLAQVPPDFSAARNLLRRLRDIGE
jgi:hypothetical protein